MILDVQSDLDRAVKFLDKIGRGEQLQFATALALTGVGYQARRDALVEISRRFQAPIPLTTRAVEITFSGRRGMRRVDKRNLSVLLAITDDISAGTTPRTYLAAQVHGGERNVKKSEKRLRRMGLLPQGWYTVPGPSAPLDAYGNIPGSAYTAMLAGVNALLTDQRSTKGGLRRVRFFVVRPGDKTTRLPPGIYVSQSQKVQVGQRAKGQVKMMRLWLAFTRKVPRYSRRFPFYEVVEQSVNKNFGRELHAALLRAVDTAR